MPIIERGDGITFAVYTYREFLTAKSSSMLKREVNMLQEEHGQYARFFELPSGDFEAVFSSEPGYLLGETVWDYFDQPNNLIFCEALDDGETALLVVIREGSVYLDAQVSLDNLYDEFASLAMGNQACDIYVYGDDLPLATHPTKGKFTFDESYVRSFERLKKPVFPQLSPDPDFELLPVADAMGELPLRNTSQLVVSAVVAALVLGLGWYFFKPAPPEPIVQPTTVVKHTPKKQYPYAAYQQALAAPTPDAVLNRLVSITQQAFTVPGWAPTNLDYEGNDFTVKVESAGGTLNILLAWSRNHAIELSQNDDIGVLTFPLATPNRDKPTDIYNLDDVSAAVYDRLKASLAAGEVSYKEGATQQNYASVDISANFQQVSPDVLTLLGTELRGLPVILEKCTIQVQNGLLSGSIDLKILGANNGAS